MSDMKCPFCQQELKHETTTGIYCCKSIFVDCPLGLGTGAFGTKELWQELIRTRKALDVAVDALKKYTGDSGNWWYGCEFQGQYEDYAGEYADKALEQITALKQKD